MDNEDDDLKLSSSTLLALQDFLREETQRKEDFERLSVQAEDDYDRIRSLGMNAFQEDWNLSQFWYSEETSKVLADEILDGANSDTRIAIISAPSVYASIIKRPTEELPTQNIYLLEYDDRFHIMAKDKFVHYDFNRPEDLSRNLHDSFDRVLVDPPFLSEECQTKASVAAKLLSKKDGSTRTIVCTGERMKEVIESSYPHTKETTFHPQHGNGLSNEFRCYASYKSSNWNFA